MEEKVYSKPYRALDVPLSLRSAKQEMGLKQKASAHFSLSKTRLWEIWNCFAILE